MFLACACLWQFAEFGSASTSSTTRGSTIDAPEQCVVGRVAELARPLALELGAMRDTTFRFAISQQQFAVMLGCLRPYLFRSSREARGTAPCAFRYIRYKQKSLP